MFKVTLWVLVTGIYEGHLQSSWTHLIRKVPTRSNKVRTLFIIPSENFVEVC
jgi:hypothetical protein